MTTLGVKSYWESRSSSQKLCKLNPAERSIEHTINNVWGYAINNLFQLSTSHIEGKGLRNWVHSEHIESMEQFFEWAEQVLTEATTQTSLIQFPPEMDENWVRYGLAKLGQISKLPNWQKIVVLCIHNTTSALNS